MKIKMQCDQAAVAAASQRDGTACNNSPGARYRNGNDGAPGSLCVNSQTGLFQYYYRNSTTLTITGSLGIGPGPGPAYLIDSKTWIIIGTTFPLLHGQETGINAVESGKHGEPAATMGLGSGSVQTSLNCSPTTGLSYSQ
jgi:hypothetical protein